MLFRSHQLTALALGSVSLKAAQFITFEHVEGRQAGEPLEFVAVSIDRGGGHRAAVRLQHLRQGLSRDHPAGDDDHQRAPDW